MGPVSATNPAGGFVATVSYVGSQGAHLLTLSETNVIDPLTGTRPYPDFGQVSWRGSISNSNYAVLSVAVKRTFSRGLLLSGTTSGHTKLTTAPTAAATATPGGAKCRLPTM